MSLPRTPSGRQHHWREGGGDADIDGLSARVNHSGTSANGTRRPRREAVCCWRAAAVEPSEGWSQTPRTRLRHPFSLLGGRVPESEAWSMGWSLKGGVCCCLLAFSSPPPPQTPPPPRRRYPPTPTPCPRRTTTTTSPKRKPRKFTQSRAGWYFALQAVFPAYLRAYGTVACSAATCWSVGLKAERFS